MRVRHLARLLVACSLLFGFLAVAPSASVIATRHVLELFVTTFGYGESIRLLPAKTPNAYVDTRIVLIGGDPNRSHRPATLVQYSLRLQFLFPIALLASLIAASASSVYHGLIGLAWGVPVLCGWLVVSMTSHVIITVVDAPPPVFWGELMWDMLVAIATTPFFFAPVLVWAGTFFFCPRLFFGEPRNFGG